MFILSLVSWSLFRLVTGSPFPPLRTTVNGTRHIWSPGPLAAPSWTSAQRLSQSAFSLTWALTSIHLDGCNCLLIGCLVPICLSILRKLKFKYFKILGLVLHQLPLFIAVVSKIRCFTSRYDPLGKRIEFLLHIYFKFEKSYPA